VYYIDITSHLFDFKNLFEKGKLTSFISDLYYQLNAGAIQILPLNKDRY
jgi:DNA-binding NtrC family response regulator